MWYFHAMEYYSSIKEKDEVRSTLKHYAKQNDLDTEG